MMGLDGSGVMAVCSRVSGGGRPFWLVGTVPRVAIPPRVVGGYGWVEKPPGSEAIFPRIGGGAEPPRKGGGIPVTASIAVPPGLPWVARGEFPAGIVRELKLVTEDALQHVSGVCLWVDSGSQL